MHRITDISISWRDLQPFFSTLFFKKKIFYGEQPNRNYQLNSITMAKLCGRVTDP
jgi:hypothetical protein